jgi:hypothetical protein
MSAEQKHTPGRFTITWRDGAYYVSIPNYNGGEVVRAEIADELMIALSAITDQLERIGDTRPHKDGAFIEDARAALTRAGWKS